MGNGEARFQAVLDTLITVMRMENRFLEWQDTESVSRLQPLKKGLADEYEVLSPPILEDMKSRAAVGDVEDFKILLEQMQDLRQLTRRNIHLLNERKVACAERVEALLDAAAQRGHA